MRTAPSTGCFLFRPGEKARLLPFRPPFLMPRRRMHGGLAAVGGPEPEATPSPSGLRRLIAATSPTGPWTEAGAAPAPVRPGKAQPTASRASRGPLPAVAVVKAAS
ncbi:hypothetical protein GCM10010421_22100 [Streptomyces glaucus]|uniref:Secreted protein n=1 Tax=Streptomyces glaucus TaxID=284029 RepID=A0ABN3JMS8_9ACTN